MIGDRLRGWVGSKVQMSEDVWKGVRDECVTEVQLEEQWREGM